MIMMLATMTVTVMLVVVLMTTVVMTMAMTVAVMIMMMMTFRLLCLTGKRLQVRIMKAFTTHKKERKVGVGGGGVGERGGRGRKK